MGRTVLAAATTYSFRRVTGVEISEEEQRLLASNRVTLVRSARAVATDDRSFRSLVSLYSLQPPSTHHEAEVVACRDRSRQEKA
jgi:hypothetical protein